jgi:hypothetical protein
MEHLSYHFEVAFDHSEIIIIFQYCLNNGFKVDQ